MRLSDGTVLQVEARAAPQAETTGEEGLATGHGFAVNADTLVAGAIPSFNEALQQIERVAADMSAMLARIAPNKAEIEFGVEISAEPGKLLSFLLVAGSSKANFKITLAWEKPHGAVGAGAGDKGVAPPGAEQ